MDDISFVLFTNWIGHATRLTVLYGQATENRRSGDVYFFMVIGHYTDNRAAVVDLPKYTRYIRIDFPVGRDDDFSASKKLKGVDHNGLFEVSL